MNDNVRYDVFISYRRKTGVNDARLLQQALQARGYKVFFDYNSIRDGRFNDGIFRAIAESKVFILMLTDGVLDEREEGDDWVRMEIRYAIKTATKIVPVLPSDIAFEFPASLPQDIDQWVKQEQISKLDKAELFEESVDKIVHDRFPMYVPNGSEVLASLPTGNEKSPRLIVRMLSLLMSAVLGLGGLALFVCMLLLLVSGQVSSVVAGMIGVLLFLGGCALSTKHPLLFLKTFWKVSSFKGVGGLNVIRGLCLHFIRLVAGWIMVEFGACFMLYFFIIGWQKFKAENVVDSKTMISICLVSLVVGVSWGYPLFLGGWALIDRNFAKFQFTPLRFLKWVCIIIGPFAIYAVLGAIYPFLWYSWQVN